MLDKNNAIAELGNIGYMAEVFRKIETENSLNIVYIGGSITQGCNADHEENRYVNLSAKWWNEKFPKADVTFFNAGIGATTSQFGAARAESHVLSLETDVVFVEFSVNDSDNLFFMETYESLVRKLLMHDSVKAVILINTLFYDTGKNTQGIHNAVGMHYELPIVSVRDYIYPDIALGNIKKEDYTQDMLHPNNKGHKMMADLIANLLDNEYETYKAIGKNAVKPELPEQLTDCRFIDAEIYQNTNSKPELSGFTADTHRSDYFSDPFKNGWTAGKAGSSIKFEVSGNIIMLQWKRTIKHPAPIAAAIIDGNEKYVLDANFEETWGDLCALTTLTENAGAGKHTVEIVVEEEGCEDNEFMLISVITADR